MFENTMFYKKSIYEYYFVIFYIFANLCLINIVCSFFVDNVMCAFAEEEEAASESQEDEIQIELQDTNNSHLSDEGNDLMIEEKNVNGDIELEAKIRTNGVNKPIEVEGEVKMNAHS